MLSDINIGNFGISLMFCENFMIQNMNFSMNVNVSQQSSSRLHVPFNVGAS